MFIIKQKYRENHENKHPKRNGVNDHSTMARTTPAQKVRHLEQKNGLSYLSSERLNRPHLTRGRNHSMKPDRSII